MKSRRLIKFLVGFLLVLSCSLSFSYIESCAKDLYGNIGVLGNTPTGLCGQGADQGDITGIFMPRLFYVCLPDGLTGASLAKKDYFELVKTADGDCAVFDKKGNPTSVTVKYDSHIVDNKGYKFNQNFSGVSWFAGASGDRFTDWSSANAIDHLYFTDGSDYAKHIDRSGNNSGKGVYNSEAIARRLLFLPSFNGADNAKNDKYTAKGKAECREEVNALAAFDLNNINKLNDYFTSRRFVVKRAIARSVLYWLDDEDTFDGFKLKDTLSREDVDYILGHVCVVYEIASLWGWNKSGGSFHSAVATTTHGVFDNANLGEAGVTEVLISDMLKASGNGFNAKGYMNGLKNYPFGTFCLNSPDSELKVFNYRLTASGRGYRTYYNDNNTTHNKFVNFYNDCGYGGRDGKYVNEGYGVYIPGLDSISKDVGFPTINIIAQCQGDLDKAKPASSDFKIDVSYVQNNGNEAGVRKYDEFNTLKNEEDENNSETEFAEVNNEMSVNELLNIQWTDLYNPKYGLVCASTHTTSLSQQWNIKNIVKNIRKNLDFKGMDLGYSYRDITIDAGKDMKSFGMLHSVSLDGCVPKEINNKIVAMTNAGLSEKGAIVEGDGTGIGKGKGLSKGNKPDMFSWLIMPVKSAVDTFGRYTLNIDTSDLRTDLGKACLDYYNGAYSKSSVLSNDKPIVNMKGGIKPKQNFEIAVEFSMKGELIKSRHHKIVIDKDKDNIVKSVKHTLLDEYKYNTVDAQLIPTAHKDSKYSYLFYTVVPRTKFFDDSISKITELFNGANLADSDVGTWINKVDSKLTENTVYENWGTYGSSAPKDGFMVGACFDYEAPEGYDIIEILIKKDDPTPNSDPSFNSNPPGTNPPGTNPPSNPPRTNPPSGNPSEPTPSTPTPNEVESQGMVELESYLLNKYYDNVISTSTSGNRRYYLNSNEWTHSPSRDTWRDMPCGSSYRVAVGRNYNIVYKDESVGTIASWDNALVERYFPKATNTCYEKDCFRSAFLGGKTINTEGIGTRCRVEYGFNFVRAGVGDRRSVSGINYSSYEEGTHDTENVLKLKNQFGVVPKKVMNASKRNPSSLVGSTVEYIRVTAEFEETHSIRGKRNYPSKHHDDHKKYSYCSSRDCSGQLVYSCPGCDYYDDFYTYIVQGFRLGSVEVKELCHKLTAKAYKYQTDKIDDGENSTIGVKSNKMKELTVNAVSPSEGEVTKNNYYRFASVHYNGNNIKFYPEVLMGYKVGTSIKMPSINTQEYKEVYTMGEELRTAMSSSMYLFKVNVSDTGKGTIKGTTNSDASLGGTVSHGNKLITVPAGADVHVNALPSGFTLDMYCYGLDNINKKYDSELKNASGTKIKSYTEIVKSNADVNSKWSNIDGNKYLKKDFEDWCNDILDVKNFAADFELRVGGTSTSKNFSAVVGDIKRKSKTATAEGVYPLTVKNGKLVEDEGYDALIKQIATDYCDSNITKAKKVFKASGLWTSIRNAIESSNSSFNKSGQSTGVPGITTNGLGGNGNWYDEKTQTFVVRRYKNTGNKITDITATDKVDYGLASSGSSRRTQNANGGLNREAKWYINIFFDRAKANSVNSLLLGKGGAYYNTSASGGTSFANAKKKYSIIVNKAPVENADFLISATSTSDF